MSKIVDDLLANVDIVDVVSQHVELKKSGVNFSGICPFHNEKTPSFVVSPQKQIFKCFGCGKGGDVITFVKEIERVDFRDAAKILAKDAHIDIAEYSLSKTSQQKNSKEYSQDKEMLKYIHKVAQNFFQEQLQKSALAQKYLKEKRKIDGQSIKEYGISYAPDSYYDLIEYLKNKGFSNDDILKSSLGKQKDSEIFSFFRNRIMFPIRDTMGNIVAFSGRVLSPQDKPKYLNSSEHIAFEKSKILYGLDIAKKHIKTHDKLIIVEGQMDVVALYRLGFPIGVATSGTALTQNHITTIKRYTPNIYLLFDNDEAGQTATIRALKLAYQQNVFPKIVTLSEKYKDVDDVANETTGEKIFSDVLVSAKDAFFVVMQRYLKKYDMTSPVDKQKFLHEIFSILLTISDITIQDHYLNEIAEQIHTTYEVLITQYKKYRATDGRLHLRQMQKPKTEKYTLNREMLLGALLIDNFITKYVDTIKEKHKNFLQLLQKLSQYETNELIWKIQNNALDVNELQEIKQMQLWRENELEDLHDVEQKYHYIRQFTMPLLQKYIQSVLGDKKISSNEKQELLNAKGKI